MIDCLAVTFRVTRALAVTDAIADLQVRPVRIVMICGSTYETERSSLANLSLTLQRVKREMTNRSRAVTLDQFAVICVDGPPKVRIGDLVILAGIAMSTTGRRPRAPHTHPTAALAGCVPSTLHEQELH